MTHALYFFRLKSELSDTEERKNAHIDNMRSRNERSITEMKNYYNDITLNNLAMISTLKEEIKVNQRMWAIQSNKKDVINDPLSQIHSPAYQ